MARFPVEVSATPDHDEPLELEHRGYAIFPEATQSPTPDICLRAQVDRRPTDGGGGHHDLELGGRYVVW